MDRELPGVDMIRIKGFLLSLFLLPVLFIPALVFSQKSRSFPVVVAVFNESTAIPYTRFFTTPVHPGILLGTEFNYKVKQHTRFFQTANICYFYHENLNQGIGIFSEAGYEYIFSFGLEFSGLFGLGYLHTFATAEEFSFEEGSYVKRGDWGNARLFPSLSLETGYYPGRNNRTSPKIFVRYQSWIEYPYSPGFIPLMTHISLQIGVKFCIMTGKTEK